jgi:hypothetical protein
MYRAHPNYCNEGPWQDWANVSFGQDEQGVFRMVPSRILLFYISITLLMTMESIAMKSELLCRHAITKWVAFVLGSYIWKRHTALCSRWQLSMKRGSSQDEVRVNVPELYLVSPKDLKSPVLVFEENPGLCESWRGKRYVWSVRDRWTEWSHMFPLLDD